MFLFLAICTGAEHYKEVPDNTNRSQAHEGHIICRQTPRTDEITKQCRTVELGVSTATLTRVSTTCGFVFRLSNSSTSFIHVGWLCARATCTSVCWGNSENDTAAHSILGRSRSVPSR